MNQQVRPGLPTTTQQPRNTHRNWKPIEHFHRYDNSREGRRHIPSSQVLDLYRVTSSSEEQSLDHMNQHVRQPPTTTQQPRDTHRYKYIGINRNRTPIEHFHRYNNSREGRRHITSSSVLDLSRVTSSISESPRTLPCPGGAQSQGHVTASPQESPLPLTSFRQATEPSAPMTTELYGPGNPVSTSSSPPGYYDVIGADCEETPPPLYCDLPLSLRRPRYPETITRVTNIEGDTVYSTLV